MSRIRFYVRVLPDERTENECVDIRQNKVLIVTNENDKGMSKQPYIKFETNGVFTDTCQSDIYDEVMGNDFNSLVAKGTDIVVCAFGEHGTGKSYTMSGLRDHYHFRGMIPRVLDSIFDLRNDECSIHISALEFSSGKCYDLLHSPSIEIDCRKAKGIPILNKHDALQVLFQSESKRRQKGRTDYESIVFTFNMTKVQQSTKKSINQKIHMVDTAGTEVHWSRLKENPCLPQKTISHEAATVFDLSADWASLAGQAIRGQVDKRLAFRNSTMVGYLYEGLRYGSIRLIGHIRRTTNDLRYTLATLRFGCDLIGKPQQRSVKIDDKFTVKALNKDLAEELQQLQDRLELSDILRNNTTPSIGQPCTEERLFQEVEKYLKGEDSISCTQLLSMANPFDALGAFRDCYRRCINEFKDKYDMEDKNENVSVPTIDTLTVKSSRKSRKRSTVAHENPEIGITLMDQLNQKSATDQGVKKPPTSADPNVLEDGKSHRIRLWEEFLSRHPYWKREIIAVGTDLKNARRERDLVEDKVQSLKSKMHQNKMKIDETSWERVKQIGNSVGYDGHIITSFKEKSALQEDLVLHEDYKATMKTFKDVHNHYIEVTMKFNKVHEAANQLFTDYVYTTYDNIFVIPSSEDYDESIPGDTDTPKQPTLAKSEEYFIYLQNKHLYKHKIPLSKPRWP